MKKLFRKLMVKRHYLLVEEKEVEDTLEIIGKHTTAIERALSVGNCGWVNERTMWFINFNSPTYKWERITNNLKNRGLIVNDIFDKMLKVDRV